MSASSVSQTKNDNLTCNECNKIFKHKNSIYNHRKSCKKNLNLCIEITKSKELKKISKTEKVECNVCSKSVSRGNLSTHKKTHEVQTAKVDKPKVVKSKVVKAIVDNITPKQYSLEETYDFLMWMHGSQQYFINSLREYKDAFDTYKKISPIIKDDKIIIHLNFDDIIKDQEIHNEIQDQEINDEIQDQEINDEFQEPSFDDNEPIKEQNIIISICESTGDKEVEESENLYEEDEELEYYCDEYSSFQESKEDNKRVYKCIKPYTSEHCFIKVHKFLERYDKCKLKEHDTKTLNKCQLSICKIKNSLNTLIRITEDDIYSESISNATKEIINNNFVTRALFSGIQLKYQELQDINCDAEIVWDKNENLKQIFTELNHTNDKIVKIIQKKWKCLKD